MIKLTLLVVILYLVPLYFTYKVIAKRVEESDYSPDGSDILFTFTPGLNLFFIIAGVAISVMNKDFQWVYKIFNNKR